MNVKDLTRETILTMINNVPFEPQYVTLDYADFQVQCRCNLSLNNQMALAQETAIFLSGYEDSNISHSPIMQTFVAESIYAGLFTDAYTVLGMERESIEGIPFLDLANILRLVERVAEADDKFASDFERVLEAVAHQVSAG